MSSLRPCAEYRVSLAACLERVSRMAASLYDITLGQTVELHRVLAGAGLDAHWEINLIPNETEPDEN